MHLCSGAPEDATVAGRGMVDPLDLALHLLAATLHTAGHSQVRLDMVEPVCGRVRSKSAELLYAVSMRIGIRAAVDTSYPKRRQYGW